MANGSFPCVKMPLKSLAPAIGRTDAELAQVDADLLLGDCFDVATPAGLTLVAKAALRKDESGQDYTRDPTPRATR